MRPLSWIASLAAVWLCAADAQAGLIFELDGIDARRIDAAEVASDHLTVTSRGHVYTIQVPEGAGASLVTWARQDTGGPLVFSIDGSLVWSEPERYRPPSIPIELGNLLFTYDAYAAGVACGATPWHRPEIHPLVKSAGERMLPHRMHEALLDAGTQTSQAYAYRRLTERFVDPPQCVGELSLYAVPGTDGDLVSVQPRSWIHILTSQWYRGIDVPSESDKWVARLPYEPLKQDIERRWMAYRAAIRPLDTLSSIVEAMALLRAIKRDAPPVWAAIDREAPHGVMWLRADTDLLEGHGFDARAWRQLARDWIASRIETPAEANLVLGLAIAGERDLVFDGIDTVAARDPVTDAKLDLAYLLSDRDPEPTAHSLAEDGRRLFDKLSQIPQLFRLRAVAVFGLEKKLKRMKLFGDSDPEDELGALITEQKAALVSNFLHRAEAACVEGSNDLAVWENLSQDVYSVALLPRLAWYGRLPARVAAAVACIHVHRGMAVQQGRQLAYRHAHYRFLKYLARHTDDERTQHQILRYRKVLAAAMNLHDSDLEDQVQP